MYEFIHIRTIALIMINGKYHAIKKTSKISNGKITLWVRAWNGKWQFILVFHSIRWDCLRVFQACKHKYTHTMMHLHHLIVYASMLYKMYVMCECAPLSSIAQNIPIFSLYTILYEKKEHFDKYTLTDYSINFMSSGKRHEIKQMSLQINVTEFCLSIVIFNLIDFVKKKLWHIYVYNI